MTSFRQCIALSALAAALSFTSCSGKKVDENDPASLMEDAEADIKGDHFAMALEKLRMIKNRFPYSKLAIDSSLRIADVYFAQESYAEAAAAYELFKDLHPKHEKVPYAMLRAAKSYLSDMPTTTGRDLSAGFKAQEAYETFLRRFTSGPEADEARSDLAKLKKMLAEKETYIGHFYERDGYKYSARPRYKKAIQLYPDTDAAKDAKDRLRAIGEQAAPDEEPNPDGRKPGESRPSGS